MKLSKKILITFFIASIAFFACQKIETYPVIPSIKFEAFVKEDSSIVFTFVDGDGNLGFKQGDTIFTEDGDTITKNLFITFFEKVDTVFEAVEFKFPLYFIIPYIEPQGQNKTLKGEISFSFASIKPFEYDTFRFEFFIRDNALNKSNVVLTPPLSFND